MPQPLDRSLLPLCPYRWRNCLDPLVRGNNVYLRVGTSIVSRYKYYELISIGNFTLVVEYGSASGERSWRIFVAHSVFGGDFFVSSNFATVQPRGRACCSLQKFPQVRRDLSIFLSVSPHL